MKSRDILLEVDIALLERTLGINREKILKRMRRLNAKLDNNHIITTIILPRIPIHHPTI